MAQPAAGRAPLVSIEREGGGQSPRRTDRCIWRGEFEEDNKLQLFTFEVLEFYKSPIKKDRVEDRLRGPVRLSCDTTGWLLEFEHNGVLPIIVEEFAPHEESIWLANSPISHEGFRRGDECIWLEPIYWIDDHGEVWITTIDENGKIINLVTQDRTRLLWLRKNALDHLWALGQIENVSIENASPMSDPLRSYLYQALSKTSIAIYPDQVKAAFFNRLHIMKDDLMQWASRKGVPGSYFGPRVPKRKLRDDIPRPLSPKQLTEAVGRYIHSCADAGDTPTQRGAAEWMSSQYPGRASRESVREEFNKRMPEDARKPGRKPRSA